MGKKIKTLTQISRIKIIKTKWFNWDGGIITICYQKKTILIVFKMNGKRGDAIERRGGGLIIRELVMRRRRGDGQKGW